MMNVLHINDHEHYAGAETAVRMLRESQEEMGLRTSLMTADDFRFQPLFPHLIKERKYVALFKRIKPDVIHVHNILRFGLAPIIAAKKSNIPLVWTFHDYAGICPNTLLFRPNRTICNDRTRCMNCRNLVVPYNYARLYDLLDDVVCVVASDYVKSQYSEVIPVRKIYWNADCTLLNTPPRGTVKRTILFGGRPDEEKGVRFAIMALKRIIREHPDSKLLFAGNYRENVFTQIARIYGVEKRISYLGSLPRDEYINVILDSDIVLCPSIWAEPFNLSLLETMSLGKPVVATDVGGQKEVMGDAGIQIEPKSSCDISDAICDLFSNKVKYKNLCRKSKERAKRFEGCAKKYLKLYESVT